MTKLLLTFTTILLLSCNQQTTTSTPASSENTDNTPDFNVALTFINDYASFCASESPPTNEGNWIKNNPLLTDNFKTDFYNLLDSARKADPELGLGFDPIFDAQDFPDKGFVMVNSDSKNGFVTVKGKDWPEFVLVLKVIKQGHKSLVDGSGIINIPADKRAKR